MKKHFLICSFAAVLLGLVGCKSSVPSVDVDDVANELAPGSFQGTETRSKTVIDGLTMAVDEWTIVDKEKSTIVHTNYVFGDKASAEMTPMFYTYVMGALADNYQGYNYQFFPQNDGGQPLNVLYWGNSLVIGNDTIGDGAAPIANLKKIVEAFSNTEWYLDEKEYHILYDTLKTEVRDTIKHVEVIDGKKQWVIDSVKVKIEKKILADTIGLKYEHVANYIFSRAAESLENTGSRKETFAWYDMNADKTDVIFLRDSVSTYNFHWGIDQVVSASRFALNLQSDETKEVTRVSLSGLDMTKKFVVTISSKEYSLVTESK